MLTGSSIKLTTIFGIRVGVNVSWFVVLFLFVFWLNQSFEDILGDSQLAFFVAVAAALGFFGSILLHEFGHALAARREGIEVSGIDLFFFGGVMKMSSDTRSPGQEFRVAVAGPLVTLLIVIVTGVVSVALLGWEGFTDSATLEGTAPSAAFELWLSFLVSMNVLLLVFNLIPAFPLDGGRIARAAVWKLTGNRGRATRVSAYLGQAFAALLIGYGLYLLVAQDETTSGLWAIVLGYLLGSSARAAIAQSAFTERLAGVTVADIMDAEPVAIPADLPAAQAWEEFFLRYYGWPWFAVVEPDGQLRRPRAPRRGRARRHDRGGTTPVRDIAAGAEDRVRDDAPLEALLGSEPLRRLGALMAVDADGPAARRRDRRAGHARAARAPQPGVRRVRPPGQVACRAARQLRRCRDRLEVVLGHARGDPDGLRLLPQVVVHERAAHQDRLPGPARQDHRRRLEPADDRHHGVEHDHVGIDLVDRLQRRPHAVRLARPRRCPRSHRSRRRSHGCRNLTSAWSSTIIKRTGTADQPYRTRNNLARHARTRRPDHRRRPRRSASRPGSGPRGRDGGHHVQGPSGPIALERRRRRDQRGR